MQHSLTLPAPAKLNLFLHITGRRSDGMHNLQTLFQLIDLADQLTFSLRDDSDIHLHCPALAQLDKQHNTVYRAACALKKQALLTQQGVDIVLDKHIPAGAGLGGGSSDAATTLLALNELWQLNLPLTELLQLGAELGADVPVFLQGRTAWAEGIGEQLTPINLPKTYYLIIFPGCHVSTAEIFSAAQLTRQTPAITLADFQQGRACNVCTPVTRAIYPAVDQALNWLNQFGAARMTGTGACCFIELASSEQGEELRNQLKIEGKRAQDWQAFVVQGLNQSPLLAKFAN